MICARCQTNYSLKHQVSESCTYINLHLHIFTFEKVDNIDVSQNESQTAKSREPEYNNTQLKIEHIYSTHSHLPTVGNGRLCFRQRR